MDLERAVRALRVALDALGDHTAQPARLRALLMDLIPEERRVVNGLVDAAVEGIPRLLTAPGMTPASSRAAIHLAAVRGMQPEWAAWCVHIWRLALGIPSPPAVACSS